jgi:hypothetical protein
LTRARPEKRNKALMRVGYSCGSLLSVHRSPEVCPDKLPGELDVFKNDVEAALSGSETMRVLHRKMKVYFATVANMIPGPSCAASIPKYIWICVQKCIGLETIRVLHRQIKVSSATAASMISGPSYAASILKYIWVHAQKCIFFIFSLLYADQLIRQGGE